MTIKLPTTAITAALEFDGEIKGITETVKGKVGAREAKVYLLATYPEYNGHLMGVKVSKGEPIIFEISDMDLFDLLNEYTNKQ